MPPTRQRAPHPRGAEETERFCCIDWEDMGYIHQPTTCFNHEQWQHLGGSQWQGWISSNYHQNRRHGWCQGTLDQPIDGLWKAHQHRITTAARQWNEIWQGQKTSSQPWCPNYWKLWQKYNAKLNHLLSQVWGRTHQRIQRQHHCWEYVKSGRLWWIQPYHDGRDHWLPERHGDSCN